MKNSAHTEQVYSICVCRSTVRLSGPQVFATIELVVMVHKKPKILVIEDDPINAMMLVDYLQSRGYDVALTMDGGDAVERFQTLQPDLLILDIQLPQRNGFDICQEINRMGGEQVPKVFMSAVFMDAASHAYAMTELKAAVFLNKPFKLKDLLAQVEALLAA